MVKVERKLIAITEADLVRTSNLPQMGSLPLVIEPRSLGVKLEGWLPAHRELVESYLHWHGGVLFSGFPIESTAVFENVIERTFGALLDYTNRSTPRTKVSGKVYTSTEYPKNETIPQHNEMSFSREWPLQIAFFCIEAPAIGGETPISDSRKVYQRIDPALRKRFSDRGVMYVRNYGGGIDLPWAEVFGTSSKLELEQILERSRIEYEWLGHGKLRTRQVCQGTARHPKTQEMVWFNQAHLFHISNLRSEMRETLLASFAEEDLPRNAYYGDGTPIEESALDHIREAYQRETVEFTWKKGDLLLLDNMLATHGRKPFEGSRQIVVSMTGAYRPV